MADFVVLSADLTRVAPNTIKDIHVEKAVIGGCAARTALGHRPTSTPNCNAVCGHSVVIRVLEIAC